MQQFTTRKDGFGEVRKQLLIATAVGHFITVSIFYYLHEEGDNSWLSTMAIFTVLLSFATYRTIKRQKRVFESFRLTMTDDALIREQHNTPEITIPKNSIREITLTSGGIFRIRGESKLNEIGIPAQIENADELERTLSRIRPIVIK